MEVTCPHCNKVVEFKPEESVLDCPFCCAKVERTQQSPKMPQQQEMQAKRGSNDLLSDAYEEGVKKGREAERKREADEAKTYLWAAIVLGAIGGGVIGGKLEGSPDQRILRVVVGILVGGLIGGMHHVFGCFLTIVIFIVATVAIVACIAV